jgi:hypothetical protein
MANVKIFDSEEGLGRSIRLELSRMKVCEALVRHSAQLDVRPKHRANL